MCAYKLVIVVIVSAGHMSLTNILSVLVKGVYAYGGVVCAHDMNVEVT